MRNDTMSKLPQLNLRIPTEYQDLVRAIAERLRERDGASFARDLTYWLADKAEPGNAGMGNAGMGDLALDSVLARLAELERGQEHLMGAVSLLDGEMRERLDALEQHALEAASSPNVTPAPVPAPTPARSKFAPFPDDVLARANDLNNDGMGWELVWMELGRPGTVNGLRNAVKKRRDRAS
jgi:hypothetical protein